MWNNLAKIFLAWVLINFFLAQGLVCAQDIYSLDEAKINKANEYYLAGKSLMEQGSYKAANEAFRKAQSLLEETQALPRTEEIDLPILPPAPLKNIDKKIAQKKDVVSGVTEKERNKANFHYDQALKFIENEEYEQAASVLEKVIQLNPQDKDAYYNLGILYEKYLNDKKQARKCYRKYLRLAPQGEDTAQIKQWIEQINKELGES